MDLQDFKPISRTKHFVKSRCIHDHELSLSLSLLWPPNFLVMVRSLAAREKKKFRREHAGLYFERLFFFFF